MGKTSTTILGFVILMTMAVTNYFFITGILPMTQYITDDIVRIISQVALILSAIINTFFIPILISAGRQIEPKDIVYSMAYQVIGICVVMILFSGIVPILELIPISSTGTILVSFTIIMVTFLSLFVLPNMKVINEI